MEYLYYNDNKEFKYSKSLDNNNHTTFKCERCGLTFNRKDNLQAHFGRKIKCYDDAYTNKVKELESKKANPDILYIDDNEEFSYYEYVDENADTVNKIKLTCNRCKVSCKNLSAIKTHFYGRKIKCYEDIQENELVEQIYKNNDDKDCKFYKFLKDNKVFYKCGECDNYTVNASAKLNMHRHFNKKIKCYVDEDYNSIRYQKGDERFKYKLVLENNVKKYNCINCNVNLSSISSLIRHYGESKNKCY